MNNFAVVGVLAFLVASVAMPTLAQTSPGAPGPNPPTATMPPAPIAPATPLAPLGARTQAIPPPQRMQTAQHTTTTRAPSATFRAPSAHVAPAHVQAARVPATQHAIAPPRR